MIKIIMIGPGSDEKGGIATVIKNFKEYYPLSKGQMVYLDSWVAGSKSKRLIVFLKSLLKLNEWLKKSPEGIVHIHLAQDGSFFRKRLLSKLAIKKGAKVILHLHGSQFDKFYNNESSKGQAKIRDVLVEVSQVVVLSREWANFIEEIVPIRVIIMENAVQLPEKIAYNVNSRKIITLGRIGHRKGSYDILNVALSLKNSLPDVVFHLYGDGDHEEIQCQLNALKLTNVSLSEWVKMEDLPRLYEDAAIHLLPSYHEGMPMAMLETMAYGIPNVISSVGGIPQVIDSGGNGILIEAGNIQQIVREIEDLMLDSAKRSKLSQEASKIIEKCYSLESYYGKWDQLYKNLIIRKEKK